MIFLAGFLDNGEEECKQTPRDASMERSRRDFSKHTICGVFVPPPNVLGKNGFDIHPRGRVTLRVIRFNRTAGNIATVVTVVHTTNRSVLKRIARARTAVVVPGTYVLGYNTTAV